MKNLGIATRCPRPFDTILIDKQGMVYPCECAGWLPVPIGNLQLESIEEILRGERLRRVQDSILDSSYRYCEESLCSYLQAFQKKGYLTRWGEESPKQQIKHIRLGIDNSCNLSCPSCRTRVIYEGRGSALQRRMNYANCVLKYLDKIDRPITLHLGSDGDPFASLVYRYLMRSVANQSNITLSIQTNGLLFKKFMQSQSFLSTQIKTLGLSIDGCSTLTYESLRRGGLFAQLENNLKYISEKKQIQSFELQFHCVVQQQNYHEMLDYIKFAQKYNADYIFFNRIVDWQTYDNFQAQDVANCKHPEHSKFLNCFNNVKQYINDNHLKNVVTFFTLDT